MTRKEAIETLRRKVKLYSALAYGYKMVRKDQGLTPGHHPCRATLTGLHCGLAVLRGKGHVQQPCIFCRCRHKLAIQKILPTFDSNQATYQALQLALKELD